MAGPTSSGPPAQGSGGLSFVLAALAAAACIVPLLIAVGSSAPGPAGPSAARAADDDVCKVPRGLSPRGGIRKRYTMILRIKNAHNARIYANPDQRSGGMRGRLRERDIFLINTRRHAATREREERWVALLREQFPCNRIIALNGLARPQQSVGSMLSLLDDPRVYGLMLDWEADDWQVAKGANRSLGHWKTGFKPNRRRIHQRLGRLVKRIKATGRREKHLGLATAFYRGWSYGVIAKTLNRRSRRIRKWRRGIQSVQIQGACQSGSRVYGRMVGRLRHDYRRLGLPTRRLATQISFTDNPIPGDSRPVNDVPPMKAARCTRAALHRRGGGAILYWARPEAIRALLFHTPVCRLRPPPRGRRAC